MKQNWINSFICVLILSISTPTYCRIQFTKLSGNEVYRALRDAGKLDAIPEGRVVTQGIAAATGFLAGVATGSGIPALIGLVASLTSSTNSTSGAMQTQEICFSSKSASEVNDENIEGVGRNVDEIAGEEDEAEVENNNAIQAEDDAYGDDDVGSEIQGRQTTGTPVAPVAPATPTTPTTPTTPVTITNNPTAGTGTTATGTGTATGTATATATPTTVATGTGTTTNGGTGTGTQSGTTTQTGGQGSVNCIVIQKPA